MSYLKTKSYPKINSKLTQIQDLTDEIKILLFNQVFGLGNSFDKKSKELLKRSSRPEINVADE